MIFIGRYAFMGFLFFLALGTWSLELLHADLSSPSYKITREWISGGGEKEVSSTAFKVVEGNIGFAAQAAMTSSNYKIESQIGLKDGIPPMPPQIDSVSPGNLSRFLTDETASYTVQARDPNGESLTYELKSDQAIKVPWQSSASLAYALAGADKGRHRLSFEVRNSDASTVRIQDQYIFHRPVK